MGLFQGSIVQEHNAMFGERAHRKFSMPWMADLPDHQHTERTMQNAGYLRRDDHSAARQSKNHIRLNASFSEMATEFPARFLA